MHRGELERGVALDAARRDIAKRLRHACAHLEEAEFLELVDRMAEIDVRYRLRDEWAFRDEPSLLRAILR